MANRTDVVAIPGLHGAWLNWLPQIACLQDDANFIVPNDAYTKDSIPTLATAILEEAPTSFALAGYSMGGYVALEIMRLAPRRVERLALISTSARGAAPGEEGSRAAERKLVEAGDFQRLIEGARDGVHPARQDDLFTNRMRMLSAEMAGSEAILNRFKAAFGRIDSRPFLGTISCPTLVLCGAEDRICPPHLSRELADAIPNARLVVVERCGHFALYEQAARVTDALSRWLRE